MTQAELNEHIAFLRWWAKHMRKVGGTDSAIAERIDEIATDLENATLAVDIPVIGKVK